jgi:hypothetical protein
MRLGNIIEVRKGKKPLFTVAEHTPGFRRLIQIEDLRPGASVLRRPMKSPHLRPM